MKFKNYFYGFFLITNLLQAQINIYGPGGPAPVFKDIAKTISTHDKIQVNITAGPLPNWINKSQENADIIFSGSEFMMNQFVNQLGNIDENTIKAVKLREAGILTRKGNPKNIKDISDLRKTNIKIIVVDGAGQISLWEDMISKNKDIKLLQDIRKNIAFFAKDSATAKNIWESNHDIDAVIIWKPWENLFKDSKYIQVKDKNKIYRPSLIAMTKEGKSKPEVQKIYNDLLSNKYDHIWDKNGWIK